MTNSASLSKVQIRTSLKDFNSSYDRCCALNGTCPVRAVKAFLESGILDINGDKLGPEDWKPLCEALSLPHELKFIAIRSFWKPRLKVDKVNGNKNISEKSPSTRLYYTVHGVAKCLKNTLNNSSCLTCLELQGLSWTLSDVELISEGLSRNDSLQHLSFYGSSFGDAGLKVIIRSLMNKFNVTSANFSHCGLTPESCTDLVGLLKHQTIQRHSMAWKDTLRQEIVNLDNMGGLQRLTLNGNPLIGDKGAHILAESLNENIWLKALDIQDCGIQDSGARAFLNSLKYNTTLYILDIRGNLITNHDLLLRISQQLHFNTQGQTSQFKWLNRASNKINTSTRKAVSSRRKRGIPWRLATRFNSARHFHSHVPGIANVFNQSQPSLLEYSSDDRSDAVSNNRRSKVKALKSCSDRTNTAVLDAIKTELAELRTRLVNEITAKKLAESKIRELTLENEKLKKNLEKKSRGTLDDLTLNAIEDVFLKFNNFLSLVQEVGYGGNHSLDKLKDSLSAVNHSYTISKKKYDTSSKSTTKTITENHKDLTIKSLSQSHERQKQPTLDNTPSSSKNNNVSSRSENVSSKCSNTKKSDTSNKELNSFTRPVSSALKQALQPPSRLAENQSPLSEAIQNASYLNIATSPLNLRPTSISHGIASHSASSNLGPVLSVDHSSGGGGGSSSISTHFSDSSLSGSLSGILVASDKF